MIRPSPTWILLFALSAAPAKSLQDAGAPQQEPAPESSSPFDPSPALLQALSKDEPAKASEFQRLDSFPALPEMRLRGLVKMRAKDRPAALIEVTGLGYLTVHEGENVTLNLPWKHVSLATPTKRTGPASPDAFVRQQLPVALRIEHIDAVGVTVEVGTLSERMVIR